MKVEVVRETPAPPPVKEVVLRLSEKDAQMLAALGGRPAEVVHALVGSSFEPVAYYHTTPLADMLRRLSHALMDNGVHRAHSSVMLGR